MGDAPRFELHDVQQVGADVLTRWRPK